MTFRWAGAALLAVAGVVQLLVGLYTSGLATTAMAAASFLLPPIEAFASGDV